MRARTPSRGFALLEALAAMVLLSAGLAAAAAMTAQTLRHGRDASLRVAALRLAESRAEDLRALRRPDGRALLAATGDDPALACAAAPATCAMEQAAALRLAAWRAELEAALPDGVLAAIEVADPSLAAYLIRIAWPQPGGSASASITLPVET